MVRFRIHASDLLETRPFRGRPLPFVLAASAPVTFDEVLDADSAAGWGVLLEETYDGSNATESAYVLTLDGGDAFIT
jgi:hypothetical protein